jgi:hypothetical protein
MIKNGFKINKTNEIYSYFKDASHKKDLQDTILASLSTKNQKSRKKT